MPTGIYIRTEKNKHSEKTKKYLSELKKGKPQRHSGSFKKGHKPYKVFLGKKRPDMSNSKNPSWKGNNAGYIALHEWVIRKLGQPNTCEHCEKTGLFGHQIVWANKDHTYKRNLTDWLRLCAKCHKQYDKINNNKSSFQRITPQK